MSETSHKNFMKRTSPIMGKVTYTKLYFQEELKMKKFTKATGIAAIIGGVVTAILVAAGKAAADKDRVDAEVDAEFEALGTNDEPTEDDVETDVIEPEETTPAEEEE